MRHCITVSRRKNKRSKYPTNENSMGKKYNAIEEEVNFCSETDPRVASSRDEGTCAASCSNVRFRFLPTFFSFFFTLDLSTPRRERPTFTRGDTTPVAQFDVMRSRRTRILSVVAELMKHLFAVLQMPQSGKAQEGT